MYIFLGNLSTKQMCDRLGIEHTDSIAEMEKCRVSECKKVYELKGWHCYDIPLYIEACDMNMAIKWRDLLQPYSSAMKESIQIGIANTEE